MLENANTPRIIQLLQAWSKFIWECLRQLFRKIRSSRLVNYFIPNAYITNGSYMLLCIQYKLLKTQKFHQSIMMSKVKYCPNRLTLTGKLIILLCESLYVKINFYVFPCIVNFSKLKTFHQSHNIITSFV